MLLVLNVRNSIHLLMVLNVNSHSTQTRGFKNCIFVSFKQTSKYFSYFARKFLKIQSGYKPKMRLGIRVPD